MRILVLSALLATACGGRSSTSTPPPPGYRFLPASPDLVVRLDLVRLRAWPLYARAAELALRDARTLLADATKQCNLDVMAEASRVVVARTGTLDAGDLTMIVSGLAREKVTSCLTTVASAGAVVKPVLDGDLVHLEFQGGALVSGAFLPGGDIVVVTRRGAGIEPQAWKAEVARTATPAPAWVRELHPSDPIAVRTASAQRTVIASVQLGDPLVIRGKLVAPTPEAAKADLARGRAILSYLEQGDAGTGRLEPAGATITGELTAKGAQIANLVEMALPALLGAAPTPTAADDSGGDAAATTDEPVPPGDCKTLAAAVEQYIKEGLDRAPADTRAAMTSQVAAMVPRLQQAFVAHCTTDGWSDASIHCHLKHATDLPRFERCRQTLTPDQRDRLDKALAAALDPAAGSVAP